MDDHRSTGKSTGGAEVNFTTGLKYQSGFGNHFASEAIEGALPVGQNSPLVCPYGLYAEQISGTSFTTPRHLNQRSWLYRIKPSVTHEPFKPRLPVNRKLVAEFTQSNSVITPTQLRWRPVEIPDKPTDFIDGLYTICGAGSSFLRHGYAIHMYTANISMDDCAFCNADGDFLVVPQKGRLWITTECGKLEVSPGEIVVLPQGFRFSVSLPDGPSRGYVAEIFGAHFQLSELGPIGANGLAASRDFLVPTAWFEDKSRPGYTIVQKYGGDLFTAVQDFCPFNVVAWHGNYAPYKYDLNKFCPYNTVLVDHGDPSINTVLTAPTDKPGVALLDFVIFPPRWLVAEHTFRPPYYHRNCMSEFMGLIHGGYEAKADGFLPGGASLHSCMTPHGPDTKTFEGNIAQGSESGPQRITNTMAFMFESALIPRICQWALESPFMDHDYYRCWIGLKSHFNSMEKSVTNLRLHAKTERNGMELMHEMMESDGKFRACDDPFVTITKQRWGLLRFHMGWVGSLGSVSWRRMAQLPPKAPPHMTQNWPAFHHHHHHTLFPPPLPPHNHHHQGQSSWMDQFLDHSSHPRGAHAHRRSMSDSMTTFLEEEQEQQEKKDGRGHHDFDGLNDEQLMSMFSDDVVTLGDSCSAVSDQDSDNGDCETGGSQIKSGHEMEQQQDMKMYSDYDETGETERPSKFHPPAPGTDAITDPKRVKRILANRQSAQRSRVKKLQYMSELEQSVTLLQTKVSALSPRVAYLDHQRLILNMDNSTLKQKIAALAQDNIFKDAHEEALKKEIERLRQVQYHQQKGNKNGSSNR